ncbi:helix-turn-helix domain-containing protein [uncultured Oscillibacter sp.]|uniref:helix-turn-helix domain-containing protein n=1 Tax=uncultured Oscillibacter sp. TaxID=876091 RepID=UPI002670839F|nr:helix-turn-helix domain-containing protein [uncultured Oscillibacter sp.]
MEAEYSHVDFRILSKLKALGMSQVQLSRETGLSTTALSSYCTGKRVPETSALYRLAKTLQTSMEWILTGEDLTNEESALPIPTCDDTPLESEEADLVAMFRLLPSYEREDLFDLVYFKYKKHVEKKMESIYWTYKEDRLKRKSAAADDGNPSGIA